MPRWRRDGRELFFISEDDTLMAAEVEAKQDKFDVKSVHPLFHINLAPEATDRAGSYDVTADGTRFIINANSDENSAHYPRSELDCGAEEEMSLTAGSKLRSHGIVAAERGP